MYSGSSKAKLSPVDGKLAVSEILTAVMTSSEIEASQTWEKAETAILSLNLFDTPPEDGFVPALSMHSSEPLFLRSMWTSSTSWAIYT